MRLVSYEQHYPTIGSLMAMDKWLLNNSDGQMWRKTLQNIVTQVEEEVVIQAPMVFVDPLIAKHFLRLVQSMLQVYVRSELQCQQPYLAMALGIDNVSEHSEAVQSPVVHKLVMRSIQSWI